jgi:hypothetical protein
MLDVGTVVVVRGEAAVVGIVDVEKGLSQCACHRHH